MIELIIENIIICFGCFVLGIYWTNKSSMGKIITQMLSEHSDYLLGKYDSKMARVKTIFDCEMWELIRTSYALSDASLGLKMRLRLQRMEHGLNLILYKGEN